MNELRSRITTLSWLGLLVWTLTVTASCSEKPPPHNIKWKPVEALPTHRAALTSLVGRSGHRLIATGYDRPEGLLYNFPLAFVRNGGFWSLQLIPQPQGGGSTKLSGSFELDDGTVYVAGRVVNSEDEPSTLRPILYRYASGAWAEVPIEGIADLEGVELRGVAARGTGSDLELRVVGSAGLGASGIVLEFQGGVWTREALPPPEPGATGWSLSVIAPGPNGRWYAAGPYLGGGGGTLYVRDGGEWRPLARPTGYHDLEFTALAFDPHGVGWITGNYPVGDSLRGELFQLQSGGVAPIPIRRSTTGDHRLFGVGFDLEGNGWVVGGRSGYLPFVASSSGGPWIEAIVVIEHEGPPGAVIEAGGGDLFGIRVLGAEDAVAVGFKHFIDPKGFLENEVNIYQLGVLPIGEIDRVTAPVRDP